MRKIIAGLFISLDGVVQNPQDWHFPYFNDEMGAAVSATLGAADTVLFGRTVRGVIEGDSIPDVFIPQLVELHRQGRFPLDRLVTEYQLSEINEAAEASLSGAAVKPVLRVPTSGANGAAKPMSAAVTAS